MADTNNSPTPQQSEGLVLEDVGREITLTAGTRVVKQGEEPNYFYVVRSGRLLVYRESQEGIRVELTKLGPGDYFGEVALVTGQPRSASVETLNETVLLQITKEEFDQVLDQNPRLARRIIQQLAQWLVSGDHRLEQEVVHQVKLRQLSWFDYALMVGLSIVFALVFNIYNDNKIPYVHGWGQKDQVAEVTLEQALKLYETKGALFVDARKDGFYQNRHIRGSFNLPVVKFDLDFAKLQFYMEENKMSADQPLVVYGGTISRRYDLDLARKLIDKGFGKVMVISGDYGAWQHAFDTEKEKVWKPSQMDLGWAGYIEWIPVSIFLLICIPWVRRSPYLSVFCRVLLGVIFVQFALSKIMRPAVFALNTADYGMMPAWGVNLWALILPWAEMVVGLFLVLGIRTRAAATLIGGMNLLFIIGLVNALWLGLPINCGCVGEAGEPVTWWKVLKNVGMLLMTVQIFLYDRLFVLDRGGFIWRERKI